MHYLRAIPVLNPSYETRHCDNLTPYISAEPSPHLTDVQRE